MTTSVRIEEVKGGYVLDWTKGAGLPTTMQAYQPYSGREVYYSLEAVMKRVEELLK